MLHRDLFIHIYVYNVKYFENVSSNRVFVKFEQFFLFDFFKKELFIYKKTSLIQKTNFYRFKTFK